MKHLKSTAAFALIFALLLSLLSCGAKVELRSAEHELEKSPHRVSTKTHFRSEDPECALLLSSLGGTNLPLVVDGERIMTSTITDDGYRLTLRVIGNKLYYNAVSTTGELKLLVKLDEDEEQDLLEKYGGGEQVTYKDFDVTEKAEGQGDEVYILKAASDSATDILHRQLKAALSSVYADDVTVLDSEMSCRISEGRFRYITTTVKFEIYLKGEFRVATMVTEESYVYSEEYKVSAPDDEYLYEEIDYSEIFGD